MISRDHIVCPVPSFSEMKEIGWRKVLGFQKNLFQAQVYLAVLVATSLACFINSMNKIGEKVVSQHIEQEHCVITKYLQWYNYRDVWTTNKLFNNISVVNLLLFDLFPWLLITKLVIQLLWCSIQQFNNRRPGFLSMSIVSSKLQ